MRAAVLTGIACLLSAAQAVAQAPTPTPAPTIPQSVPTETLMEMTGTAPDVGSATGRPFSTTGPRFWAGADYTLFWYTPMNCQTLIRTFPAYEAVGGANPTTVLGQFPSKSQIQYNAVSGARVNGGVNFDKFGVDFSGFLLQTRTMHTDQYDDGNTLAIAQPYISAGTGTGTNLFASLPGAYGGGVSAAVSSQLWGLELNATRPWYVFLCDSTSLIGGFRYLDLQESIGISSNSLFPSGLTQNNTDSIRTHNSYYGAQFGFHGRIGGDRPGFGAAATSKMALGAVNQRVDLVGSNTIVPFGGPASVESGGLYVRGANQGTFSRGEFAFLYDLDLKLTYNFTSWFQVSMGYSVLYLSSVVRPGDQIDPVVNDQNIRFVAAPTPSTLPNPTFVWRAHSFVVQGITFGAQIQY